MANYAFLYNVESGTTVPANPRTEGSDVMLASGWVLIAGGINPKSVFEAPILYDPSADQVALARSPEHFG